MTGELGGNWTVSDDGKLQNSTDIVLDGANKTIYFNNKSTYASATTGIFIGYDSGIPKVNIGSDTAYLKWDGTDLLISGEISASTGIIGGWTIGETSISSYGITLYASEAEEETPYIGIGKETYASNGGIWLGKDDTAWKMSIDNADGSQYLEWTGTEILIKATNFELDSSGNITITGGTIGGWTIGETTITAENIIIDSEGSLETVGYEAGVFDTDVEVETKSSDGSGEIVLTYPALAILSVVLAATEDPVEYTYVPQTKTVTNLALSTSHKITYLKDTSTAGSGWMIASDGSAFFNDVTVFGTLYSNGGNIAGWDINEGYLANGNIVLNTSGEIYTANYNHRISGWKIRYDGFAEFNNVLVRGEIESETGNIGGWLITETTLESEGETGVVMSSAGSIASKNFVIDTSGWKIFGDGTAEFADVIVRSGSLGTTGELDGWSIGDGKLYNSTDIVLDANSKQIYLNNKSSYASATAGVFIGYDTDAYKVSIGTDTAYLKWDGTDLTISGEISATAGDIGGWDIDATTISSNSLTLTSGENPYIGIGTTTYGSAGIWLGKDTAWKASFYADASNYLLWDGTKLTIKAANFTLDSDGKLTATSADITGAIKATSGYIGGTDAGWQIDTGVLKNSTAVVLDATNKQIYFNNKNAYASDTAGIFMGYDTDAYKVNIGDAASYIKWDGTDLTISGELTASTGAIGGWTIDTNSIYSGNVYIRSDESRFEINVDESVKLAMGYLDGIGDFTATDFGIYVGAADAIYIEATENDEVIHQIKGDWIVKHDANIIINSTVGETELEVLRLGKYDTDRGLFLFDDEANILAAYTSSGIIINIAGTNMKIGNDVESTNDGIYIGTTNYWYSDGSFKLGSADSYITGSSSGIAVTSTNFTVDTSGTIMAKDGTIGGWDIAATTLSSNNITISSATDPYIGLGITAYDAVDGIWLGSVTTGEPPSEVTVWKLSINNSDSSEYLKWDGSKLLIKSANFEIDADGDVTLTGDITAITGTIGGWTIGETTITAGDIILDATGSISGNFETEVSGWSIDATGDAEFNSITIRSGAFEDGTLGGATGWEVTTGLLQDADETIILDAANKKVSIGSYVALGSDVVTEDYIGLKITADNYWETDGTYTKLSLGGGKLSYDDSSGIAILSITGEVKATSGYIGGTASGWVIDEDVLYAGTSDTEYSVLLDSNNAILNIHRPEAISYPAVSLGMAVLAGQHGLAFYNNTTGASTNYWVWDTNAVKFKVGDGTNYIDFNVGVANKLKIVTDTFSLATTNLTIDSANEKIAMGGIVLQGGANPYIGINTVLYNNIGDPGIWMGKESEYDTWVMSIVYDANNYFVWDSTKLLIKTAKFSIGSAGTITATGGTIGGWTLADTTISSTGLELKSSATAPYLGLGITAYDANSGIWLGKDTSWKLSIKNSDGTQYLKWDGSKLLIKAANFELDADGKLSASSATISGAVTASSGTIGGWTVGASSLSSTNITISSGTYPYIGLNTTSYNDTGDPGIWMGRESSFGTWVLSMIYNSSNYFIWDSTKLLIKTGNFQLGSSGNVTASSVDLTGKITATSGAIGGWNINTELYSGISVTTYSILLDSTNSFIGINKAAGYTSPLVKFGMSAYDGDHGLAFYESDGDSANNYWVWDNSSMRFRAGDATNYISFNADVSSKLAIKTDTFDLQSTNFNVISGAYPYMGVYAKKFMGTGIWTGKGAEETITPNMAANVVMSAGDGTYTASNSASGSTAWYLFNSNSSYIAHAVGAWTKIALPVRKIVYEYNIYSGSVNYYPKGWRLEGSNDNTNWEILDEESAHVAWSGYLDDNLEIDNPKAFLYYRLYITEVNTPSYTSAYITRLDLYDLEGYKLSVVGSGTDPNYMRFSTVDGLIIRGNFVFDEGSNYLEFVNGGLKYVDGYAPFQGYTTDNFPGMNIIDLNDNILFSFAKVTANPDPEESGNPMFLITGLDYATQARLETTKLTFYTTASGYEATGNMIFSKLAGNYSNGYFTFNYPIKVLYGTGGNGNLMPNGSIFVQGNYLYYRDSSGTWRRLEGTSNSPS